MTNDKCQRQEAAGSRERWRQMSTVQGLYDAYLDAKAALKRESARLKYYQDALDKTAKALAAEIGSQQVVATCEHNRDGVSHYVLLCVRERSCGGGYVVETDLQDAAKMTVAPAAQDGGKA